MLALLIFVQILLIYASEISNNELVSVSVIFRHGDRTINEHAFLNNNLDWPEGSNQLPNIFRHGDRTIRNNSYPNDPYKSISYWPEGFGQLTSKGKLRHFELGQWFRKRYDTFLSKLDLEKDLYVLSSDVERTIMSAENHLAGLFPATHNAKWNPAGLQKQSIPIHIIPKQSDNLLLLEKTCPKHKDLLSTFRSSPEVFKINEDNRDIYEYLSVNTGSLVEDATCVAFHYKTLQIENENGFVLPNWTKSVFPSKLEPISGFSFAIPTFNNELARLKVGPLVNKIAEQLENESSKKFIIYSAHDVTVAGVLNALKLFEYHFPPYAATIIFELRRVEDKHFVNIFYKNGSDLQDKTLENCEFDCPVDKFLDIIHPVRLSTDQWDEECKNINLK